MVSFGGFLGFIILGVLAWLVVMANSWQVRRRRMKHMEYENYRLRDLVAGHTLEKHGREKH